MRQLFSVLFLFFASLFFSQCEIGKISFALEDVLMFFINGKVEGEDKNENQKVDQMTILGAEKPKNIDEIVIKTQGKANKSIITITPCHKKTSSNMSDGSSYSVIFTTASQNKDGHNEDKKGVFDSAKDLSYTLKHNLINSFNYTQDDGDDSYDECIEKNDNFVGKERVGRDKKELLIHNNKWQQKRKGNEYFDLINNKIKEREERTLYFVKGGEGSSIFVQRHASIVNKKIFQEVGDKKDVHKNVNISQKKNRRSIQLVRKNKYNNVEKLRKSPTHKNNIKIENFYCKVNINNNGKKKSDRIDSGIKFIRVKRFLVKRENIGNDSSTYQESKTRDDSNYV